jgi:ubiquinone/menaquinone biosynthesis C-methylase UbiE
MNEFDIKAAGWDLNPMHIERAESVAKQIAERIPLNTLMTALEFGAGTGLNSFLLKDKLREITMLDSSPEMVKIIKGKIESVRAVNLKALCFDLETQDWNNGGFDLIMTQMVLHHVADIDKIVKKFYMMLNPGGYLAIADLYPEDGSFHGAGFKGHNGFDTEALSSLIRNHGFKNVRDERCFVINKKISESETRQFDVFLMTAGRI